MLKKNENNSIAPVADNYRDSNSENTAIEMYLDSIHGIPMLSAEDERSLLILAQNGDIEARDRLVYAHQPLVINVAKKYGSQGIELMDLIQEGNIGLMEAIDRFDLCRENIRLSAYAVWYIRLHMTQAVRTKTSLLAKPERATTYVPRVKEAEEILTSELGRNPTPEEIAKKLNMRVGTVEHVLELPDEPLLMHGWPNGENESCIGDFIMANDNTEETVINAMSSELLRNAIDSLNEQEAYVITRYFGMDGADPDSLGVICERIGVTRQRTHQIKSNALKKLRSGLSQYSYVDLVC